MARRDYSRTGTISSSKDISINHTRLSSDTYFSLAFNLRAASKTFQLFIISCVASASTGDQLKKTRHLLRHRATWASWKNEKLFLNRVLAASFVRAQLQNRFCVERKKNLERFKKMNRAEFCMSHGLEWSLWYWEWTGWRSLQQILDKFWLGDTLISDMMQLNRQTRLTNVFIAFYGSVNGT